MIKYVLGFFSPENMRVDVVSKSLNKSQGNLSSIYGVACCQLHSFSTKLWLTSMALVFTLNFLARLFFSMRTTT